MSPDDREFGELVGEVKGVGKQLAEMQAANTREHSAVLRRLDAVDQKLDHKANEEWVREHESRIDSLERTRDQDEGGDHRGALLAGAGEKLILLGLAVAAFVLGRGGF